MALYITENQQDGIHAVLALGYKRHSPRIGSFLTPLISSHGLLGPLESLPEDFPPELVERVEDIYAMRRGRTVAFSSETDQRMVVEFDEDGKVVFEEASEDGEYRSCLIDVVGENREDVQAMMADILDKTGLTSIDQNVLAPDETETIMKGDIELYLYLAAMNP